jgi:hypothetical protein
VVNYLGDNGNHGYVIPTPASLSDGATHTIHLRFETSATELNTGSPATLSCSPLPAMNSLSLGSSAYLHVGNSGTLNITGPMTVEAWIKTNSSAQQQGIVERYSSTDGGYALRLSSTGLLQFFTLHNGTTFDFVQSGSAVPAGAWHHVAGVFDGSQLRVYIDGVLAGSKASTFAPATGTATLKIGGRGDDGSFSFNGLIDEARVSWAVMYTSNFSPIVWARATGTTVGLWHFDNVTWLDSSRRTNLAFGVNGPTLSTDVP